jgi:hypothetical protein
LTAISSVDRGAMTEHLRTTTRTIRTQRRLAVLVASAAIVLAACGGGGDSGSGEAAGSTSAPSGGTSDGGAGGGAGACGGEVYVATVCATVAVTGAASAEGSTAAPVGGAVTADGPATCSSWAQGVDGDLELPLFLDGLEDGTAFGMESLVTDYGGPGTYGIDQLSGRGSDFTIVVGDERYQPDPEGTSTAELTVADDGSGSLSASGFRVDDGSGTLSDPIDAEVTWTCTDA